MAHSAPSPSSGSDSSVGSRPHDAQRNADDTPPFRYTARLADEIERRWQTYWDEHRTFVTPNPGEPSFDASREKYYVLDMFPYPSGAGLHVGHPEGYTATDIVARYYRMKGRNVLHPMGWDAFGLPAEQYAIQTGVHPEVTTREAIKNFRRQLKRFGFSYDWSREFGTIDPEYYKWTQWIFLRAYNAWYDPWRKRARPIAELIAELSNGDLRIDVSGDLVHIGLAAGISALGGEPVGTRRWHELTDEQRRAVLDSQRLAYLGETTVNWCPVLGTVLANDEVIDGKSERGGHPVLRKPLRQWMFRITAYADRLLNDLEPLEWPESTKVMQREWIGRSEGAEIDFEIVGISNQMLRVFTTRPDTIFGATYMVVAPEHPLVQASIGMRPAGADVAALRAYVEAARSKSDIDRQADSKEKTGVFTGLFAVNPANGEQIPIWAADYVLMGYGHGAIMAVPAHDERDFAFAKKFHLNVREVVQDPARKPNANVGEADSAKRVFSGQGVAINSANAEVSLDGLTTDDAKAKIGDWLEKTGVGNRKVNFRLRDWAFSRQRYWGEPFPIVYDQHGNHYPVGDAALPVKLPELDDYAPEESDEPMPLLAKARSWANTTAGAAGVDPSILPPETPVRRETNTMPGSAGSSWYAIRYCDPRNDSRFVSTEAEAYWMAGKGGKTGGGVDLYIGGPEHAVGHLLYARFWQKVLFDLGEVAAIEPFHKLFHQGMITSFSYQRADKRLVPSDQVKEVSEGQFIEIATGEKLTPVVAKMSKSLKNVVNPDDIIAEYGADTFRMYEMYMGPLEASKPWNTKDTVGLFRFLQRAWRLIVDEQTGAMKLRADDAADPALERQLHRMVAKIDADIPALSLNTAIAAMFEFVNAATSVASAGSAAGGGAPTGAALTKPQVERFALALAPFAPHMAEEFWYRLGHPASLAYHPFPVADPKQLMDDEVEIPVQINSKVRAKIMVSPKADKAALEAAAMADVKVQELLAGQTPKKVIVVPGKMVNFVM